VAWGLGGPASGLARRNSGARDLIHPIAVDLLRGKFQLQAFAYHIPPPNRWKGRIAVNRHCLRRHDIVMLQQGAVECPGRRDKLFAVIGEDDAVDQAVDGPVGYTEDIRGSGVFAAREPQESSCSLPEVSDSYHEATTISNSQFRSRLSYCSSSTTLTVTSIPSRSSDS
jgi:hypothetical protein